MVLLDEERRGLRALGDTAFFKVLALLAVVTLIFLTTSEFLIFVTT